MSKDLGALSGSHPTRQAQGLGASRFDPAREILERLRPIVNGGDSSCLRGTPMIPLHRDTVRALFDFMDERTPVVGATPKAICGYPLPGWRLQLVEYDNGAKINAAPSWLVSLHSEPADYCGPQSRYRSIMARSLLGPLEAWDEALGIALRENELLASVDRSPEGQDAPRLDRNDESAAAKPDAQTPSGTDHD